MTFNPEHLCTACGTIIPDNANHICVKRGEVAIPDTPATQSEWVLPEISRTALLMVIGSPRYDAVHKQLANELLSSNAASPVERAAGETPAKDDPREARR